MASATKKHMCTMCSPKPVAAVTSCKGCSKDLCRKHFNEHRDTLSKDLYNVFDLHDGLLQELQIKMDSASKPSDNDNARAVFKEIDEWERTTIERVSQAANEARADVPRLFNGKVEYDQLKQKVVTLTEELKEQQESENFVETDIDHWIRQIEQLKTDLNRPSEDETNFPVLQIQNIDWSAIIKFSSPSNKQENDTNLSQNQIDSGRLCLISIECSLASITSVTHRELTNDGRD